MSSHVISLTGNSSELSHTFSPELNLDDKYEYSCGLLDFVTYHSIPNITHTNNNFFFTKCEKKSDKNQIYEYDVIDMIEVPIGCYEAEDVLKYIKTKLIDFDVTFEYEINKNTLKTTFKCSARILFGFADTIYEVFGFKGGWGYEIPAHKNHESDDIIKISKLNIIRVECNIVTGAYVNGKPRHTIHEFASNKVHVGYKIIEQPRNIIYLPLIQKRINSIHISIVDQEGWPIDFRSEEIACRIHIKRDDK